MLNYFYYLLSSIDQQHILLYVYNKTYYANLYKNNCLATGKLSRFYFMTTLVEELCSTRMIRFHLSTELFYYPKKGKTVVCSDRPFPAGQEILHIMGGLQCRSTFRLFDSLHHKTKKKKATNDWIVILNFHFAQKSEVRSSGYTSHWLPNYTVMSGPFLYKGGLENNIFCDWPPA